MKEVLIDFDNKSPANLNDSINIWASSDGLQDIQYKFIEGLEGVWNPIQDFSQKNICTWSPKKPGKYMIMVQGKEKDSKKPYDFLGRAEFEVKDIVKIIKNVKLEKNKIFVGEKLNLTVESEEDLLLYRFWIRGQEDWELLQDYSTEKTYIFTGNEAGAKEILVECKRVESGNNVDDFITLKIEVKDLRKIEITNFKCFTKNMIVGEELIFKVEANYDEKRPLLYKFLKVNNEGRTICVQDYSSKSIVSFKEKVPGDYKLLCLVRDVFSSKEYDDRAFMIYSVQPYENIKIRSFKADIKSPQPKDTVINLKANVEGGRELLYRYIIEGPVAEDSGYIRKDLFQWRPSEVGDYTVTLKTKDISFSGDYEDISKINYKIDIKGEKAVRIIDVKSDKERKCLVGQPINIKVKAEGGGKLVYEFIVYKDGVKKEKIDYGVNNWVDFIPIDEGEYEVEVRVKDFYSIKEFDSCQSLYIEAKSYLPAEIKYVLTNAKEFYLVHDTINIEAIMLNTKDTLVKFVTSINGYEVENTGFIESKRLKVTPKCPGKYSFSIYAKNIKSTEEYDCKKEISIYVQEDMPVTGTKVYFSTEDIRVGKEVSFQVESKGGKDVCYEFYIMNKGNWALVQGYSRKNYYTFIPFKAGEYRLLVLSKSFYKKVNYEDYTIVSFSANE